DVTRDGSPENRPGRSLLRACLGLLTAAVVAGAGDCAAVGAGDTVGRTAPTGPDEVGAPSPGRRPAALRCTGAAGVADLPVSGGDSGTAPVDALWVPGVAGEVGAVTVVAGLGPSGADGPAGAAGSRGAPAG
ncbi:hypothetical protein ABZX63_41190, partial [Streptomyces tendae]